MTVPHCHALYTVAQVRALDRRAIEEMGIPGYELMRRVRALPPSEGGQVPAAAITAYARAEDKAEATRTGFQAHLVKPVRAEELVAIVKRLAASGGTADGSKA